MRKSFLLTALLAFATVLILTLCAGVQNAGATEDLSVLQSSGADAIMLDGGMTGSGIIGAIDDGGRTCLMGGSGSMIGAIDGGGCCIIGAVLIDPTGHPSEPLVSMEKGYIFVVKFDDRIVIIRGDLTLIGHDDTRITGQYDQGGVTLVTERVLCPAGTSNALYQKGPAAIVSSA